MSGTLEWHDAALRRCFCFDASVGWCGDCHDLILNCASGLAGVTAVVEAMFFVALLVVLLMLNACRRRPRRITQKRSTIFRGTGIIFATAAITSACAALFYSERVRASFHIADTQITEARLEILTLVEQAMPDSIDSFITAATLGGPTYNGTAAQRFTLVQEEVYHAMRDVESTVNFSHSVLSAAEAVGSIGIIVSATLLLFRLWVVAARDPPDPTSPQTRRGGADSSADPWWAGPATTTTTTASSSTSPPHARRASVVGVAVHRPNDPNAESATSLASIAGGGKSAGGCGGEAEAEAESRLPAPAPSRGRVVSFSESVEVAVDGSGGNTPQENKGGAREEPRGKLRRPGTPPLPPAASPPTPEGGSRAEGQRGAPPEEICAVIPSSLRKGRGSGARSSQSSSSTATTDSTRSSRGGGGSAGGRSGVGPTHPHPREDPFGMQEAAESCVDEPQDVTFPAGESGEKTALLAGATAASVKRSPAASAKKAKRKGKEKEKGKSKGKGKAKGGGRNALKNRYAVGMRGFRSSSSSSSRRGRSGASPLSQQGGCCGKAPSMLWCGLTGVAIAFFFTTVVLQIMVGGSTLFATKACVDYSSIEGAVEMYLDVAPNPLTEASAEVSDRLSYRDAMSTALAYPAVMEGIYLNYNVYQTYSTGAGGSGVEGAAISQEVCPTPAESPLCLLCVEYYDCQMGLLGNFTGVGEVIHSRSSLRSNRSVSIAGCEGDSPVCLASQNVTSAYDWAAAELHVLESALANATAGGGPFQPLLESLRGVACDNLTSCQVRLGGLTASLGTSILAILVNLTLLLYVRMWYAGGM